MKTIDELPVRRVHGSGLRQLRSMLSDNSGVILVDDSAPAIVAMSLLTWQEFLKRIAAAAA